MNKVTIIPTATITNKPRVKYIGDLLYHTLDRFFPKYWGLEHFILNLTPTRNAFDLNMLIVKVLVIQFLVQLL